MEQLANKGCGNGCGKVMASETEIERLLFAASIGWESAINSLKREDGLPVEFVGVPENPYRKRLHALRLATGTVAA